MENDNLIHKILRLSNGKTSLSNRPSIKHDSARAPNSARSHRPRSSSSRNESYKKFSLTPVRDKNQKAKLNKSLRSSYGGQGHMS